MANFSKSADDLIKEVSASIKQELHATIQPIVKRISEAVNELERALAGGKTVAAAPVVRRGRRPGVKAAAAKVKTVARKTASGRSPRGALQAEIRKALHNSGPLSLAGMRDEILKSSEFKGRAPKTIYTQIVQGIKRIPELEKTSDGKYKLR